MRTRQHEVWQEGRSSTRILARLALGGLLATSPWLGMQAAAQEAYLVEDLRISPQEGDGAPWGFVRLGDVTYFAARTPAHGRELWRTDGTAQGTHQVADLCPGLCESFPWPLATAGSRLFLRATDGASGEELWSLEPGGEPRRLRDICPGPCSAGLFEAEAVGEVLFFAAADGTGGRELWTSDGSPEGTRMVLDLCPGSCSADPRELTAFEGLLYFAADDGTHGRELWTSDGTPEGTRMVADLCPGCDADPRALAAVGGRLYFGADDGSRGREPWETDGTAEGTALLADLLPGSRGADPRSFRRLLDTLYVLGDCQETAFCAWKRQAGGFGMASELFPEGSRFRPFETLEHEGALYFTTGRDLASHGHKLWATDGTTAGTRPVFEALIALEGLTPAGGGLLFGASTLETGSELWFTGGTAASTVSLGDLRPGVHSSFPREFTPTAHGILFSADDPQNGRELWVTDGTAAGTEVLVNLGPAEASSAPRVLAVLGRRVLLAAREGRFQTGLWASDGRAEGTLKLTEGFFQEAVVAGGRAFFTDGFRFWVTDGTPEGTGVLAEVEDPRELAALAPDSSVAALVHGDFGAGQKLWHRDLETGEATLLADPNPDWHNGPCVFDPCSEPAKLPATLTTAGDGVFFLASEPGTPIQLWAADGEGARRLATFDTGQVLVGELFAPQREDLFPRDLVPFRDGLLFSAFELGSGREPWVSDGTPEGTRPLGDLVAGEASSDPRAFALTGDAAYFFARTAGAGDTLWVSDGTPEGTRPVVALAFGADPAHGGELVAANGRLFFTAFSEAGGAEIGTSDGTADGTVLADLRQGPLGSGPRDLVAVGRRVVFAADDGLSGHELWLGDGTGFVPLGDLAPGAAASSPAGLVRAGGRIFFSADDGLHGRELWALPLGRARVLVPMPEP